MSAGAVEDDDILYHGSGPKKGITFEIPVARLRAEYKHTCLREEASVE